MPVELEHSHVALQRRVEVGREGGDGLFGVAGLAGDDDVDVLAERALGQRDGQLAVEADQRR